MPFSLFNTLNPTSKHTGFIYEDFIDGTAEMVDLTVSEHLDYTRNQNLVGRIFDILVGDHYYLLSPHDSPRTSKGVLDFLIFPLIARALILAPKSIITTIIGFAIAIPLEIARFSLGIALTILLTPIIALINLIQDFLPEDDVNCFSSVSYNNA
jgi:hypothetical protein